MSAFPAHRPISRRALLLGTAATLLAVPAARLLTGCASDTGGGAGASGSAGSPAPAETSGTAVRDSRDGPPAAVLVLHHAHGLTAGVLAFAEQLRRTGLAVHAPDLYDGRTFATLDEGVAHARSIGFSELQQRGLRAAEALPEELIYVGFSLGVLPAQRLAQTRAGARGAVLLEACVPPSQFSSSWPPGVPVQIHGMENDPVFAGEGDLVAARALVTQTKDAELFTYPGNRHLFTDSSLPTHDPDAAALVTERVSTFLTLSQQ